MKYEIDSEDDNDDILKKPCWMIILLAAVYFGYGLYVAWRG